MTTISTSTSRLLKGALVGLDPLGGTPSYVPFQYNPSEINRTIAPSYSEGVGPGAGNRLAGPPVESFSLQVELLAADRKGAGPAGGFGLYPQLAALEMLMYPPVAQITANIALSALGMMEVVPPAAPLTLFVWGIKRVQPVRLTSYSVTETYHDAQLNPIAARVSLGLQALSYRDFPPLHPGGLLALANQAARQAMASAAVAGDLAGLVTGGAKLF